MSLPPGPRFTPGKLPALARKWGVPPDVEPGVADLEVGDGQVDGWVVTATDTRPTRIAHDGSWPAGRLTVVGGLLLERPTDPAWPPILHLGGTLIAGFRATLTIPGGRATALTHWLPTPAGLYELRSSVHLGAGRRRWKNADVDRATRALRWLETLRQTGSGRRREYDDTNKLQLLQELGDAVHAVVGQGERAGYTSVARELGRDRRTVKTWVEASPWDLQAIEREALRCTGPRRVNSCTFHVRRAAEYRRKGV